MQPTCRLPLHRADLRGRIGPDRTSRVACGSCAATSRDGGGQSLKPEETLIFVCNSHYVAGDADVRTGLMASLVALCRCLRSSPDNSRRCSLLSQRHTLLSFHAVSLFSSFKSSLKIFYRQVVARNKHTQLWNSFEVVIRQQ